MNVCVVGGLRSGKTAVVRQYLSHTGVDLTVPLTDNGNLYFEKCITIGETAHVIKIFDIHSHDTQKELIRSSEAIIFIYSITAENSFQAVEEAIKAIKKKKSGFYVGTVIGCKCELEHKRKVPIIKGFTLAKLHNFSFFELSTYSRVDQPFEEALVDFIKGENNKKCKLM